MSVDLLKNIIARGAMAKNAASLASHPNVVWAHMRDMAQAPAAAPVDKKAAINAILAPVLGKQAAVVVQPVDKRAVVADLLQKNAGIAGGVANAGRNMLTSAGNAVRKAPLQGAAVAAPGGVKPNPIPSAALYKKDAGAIVADLLKNAGIVGAGLDLGRKGLSYLGRGASAAGNAALSGAKQTAQFATAHPLATGTALGGAYMGGKAVGFNRGSNAQGKQDSAQLARYGATAGGAALGGIGGNMLAGAFGGGRVARTLATLIGAAGGGAAGYYAMDPAVQAKVKALFS